MVLKTFFKHYLKIMLVLNSSYCGVLTSKNKRLFGFVFLRGGGVVED